ncbi:Lmo0720 protein [Secundilactobacillus oryzae JCM 18671]|uniref:Lmo0720 protein n=1 Tax=Secundilactobacillus oryzae JCM 18671 TaxID=1291743 RepID=A0A081BIH7_9LACO|nr:Lmo0720 protein [Secundilactobacillus oryzae JCM 18671]
MKAIEKYFWTMAKGDGMMRILISVLELFENAVADDSPISAVVGDDIAEFADTILADYPEETWLDKQRNALRRAYNHRG